jgi:hypothetical protein
MKDDFRDSFTEFALDKRPSAPEVARVLREVRRQRSQKKPPYHLWTLGVGGWLVAAISLTMLAKHSHEPQEEPGWIQSAPDWIEPPPCPQQVPALPPQEPTATPPCTSSEPPPRRSPRRPVLAISPERPSRIPPAPSASAAEPSKVPEVVSSVVVPPASAATEVPSPHLLFEESLLLARGHFRRLEGMLEVLRKRSTNAQTRNEPRCLVEPFETLRLLREAFREQLIKLEAAKHSEDVPAFTRELERLMSLHRTADGELQKIQTCMEAR